MRSALVVYVALTALTLAVFAIWPELDRMVAHYFFDPKGFFAQDSFERSAREFFRLTHSSC